MFCHRFYHCPQTQKPIPGRTPNEKWLESIEPTQESCNWKKRLVWYWSLLWLIMTLIVVATPTATEPCTQIWGPTPMSSPKTPATEFPQRHRGAAEGLRNTSLPQCHPWIPWTVMNPSRASLRDFLREYAGQPTRMNGDTWWCLISIALMNDGPANDG